MSDPLSDALSQDHVWDADAADGYDTPGVGMFSPDVLGPTVATLSALAGGGPALEFAIGTGRVGIPLAAAGVPVTGIELSEPMVARLREKVDAATLPVHVGDMTTTVVPGEFSLVYLVFNTISNVLTQAGQVECFRNAARHLAPGGRFVIELWVPEFQRIPGGGRGQIWTAERGYVGLDVYDAVNQLLVSHHFRFDPESPGREARVARSPHRYIWPSELDLMAQLAGFELESRNADWSGGGFTADSSSHISVYRLREHTA